MAPAQYSFPLATTTCSPFENMNDVTLVLDGTVWAWTEDFLKWPNDNGAVNLFQFTSCTNLVIMGNGIVEGQVCFLVLDCDFDDFTLSICRATGGGGTSSSRGKTTDRISLE